MCKRAGGEERDDLERLAETHLVGEHLAGRGGHRAAAAVDRFCLSLGSVAGDITLAQGGFAGVVITDDLEMGAIREHYSLEETVVRAVTAGVDVLLFSNTSKNRLSLASEVRTILVNQAEADPAFRKRLYDTGMTVTEWNVRSRPNNKGAHHIIWFAQKS